MRAPRTSFPIVGVGASAGGLEAFTQLLGALSPDTGMAFVLVQHLDPSHPSLLSAALAKATKMRVHEIRDGMVVEPDNVYVIPPNAELSILRGALILQPRPDDPRRPHMPIDVLFRALAADRRSQAIGVVLSGTATDGTEGLRAIKAEGGVTFAQDPRSAKFSGMPQSAVAAGVVDFRLPVRSLARELARLGRHPYLAARAGQPGAARGDRADLRAALLALRDAVGVDFSEYKEPTIRRRLARRMALRKIEGLGDYARVLKDEPGEAAALYEDILIDVTSLFRDPQVFEKLKALVFPEVMKHKAPAAPVRMWVCGCSNGDEAYSLAITLFEFLGDSALKRPIQIFATDLSERAIERARAGFFRAEALRDLSPERLRRFFVEADGGYRIIKAIRDACTFVKHDVARDPPFSRLDVVSCRNVLIYFNSELQRRVLATFHYGLNRPGFLLLGSAEDISAHHDLFSRMDKENKIFARTAAPGALPSLARYGAEDGGRRGTAPPSPTPSRPGVDVGRLIDDLLIGQYAPAGVVVNEKMEIVQFRGRTGPYLEPAPGDAELNLLKMAREGLLPDLQIALAHARKKMATARRESVQVHAERSTRMCNIVVTPVRLPGSEESKERLFLVLFEDVTAAGTAAKRGPTSARSGRRRSGPRQTETLARLDAELKTTKAYLRSLTDEHQRTNDALASVNEELVSSNEELQSMNEELETAKEELQSTNEELTTVNDELQSRNQEVSEVNSDLVNVLNSVEVAMLIVDTKRRIRRFTPKARSLMNLLPGDVGRPLGDITPNVMVGDLNELITEVLDTMTIAEREIPDRDGHWYRLQIRPYRTVEAKIGGVILSLVDIDVLRRAVDTAELARDYARSIVEAVQTPLLVLGPDLSVVSANQAFYDEFRVSRAETEGRGLFELGMAQWDIPVLRATLGEMLDENTSFQDVEVDRVFPGLGARVMRLSGRPVDPVPGLPPLILLAIEDITDRRERERERAELLRRAEEADRAKDLFLATLSHELRAPLSSLLMQAQLLRRGNLDEAKVRSASETIERATRMQVQLIADLLDSSRIVADKLTVAREPVDLAEAVRSTLDMVSTQADENAVSLHSHIDSVGEVIGDQARLQQVVWNLLSNAIRFTPKGGRVDVTLERADGRARIQVRDTGIGIEPEFLPRVFERFSQAEGGSTRARGGLGLGLAIARRVVELHGGTVQAESAGKDQGSIFTVVLPLRELPPEQRGPGEAASTGRASKKVRRSRNLGGMRILLVDDDADSRETYVEMLGQSGASVRAAASAAEAMRMLEELAPDVLVCDIAMPGEDGYGLLRRIRAREPGAGGDVPALALTALAEEEHRQRALAAGFQMHLAKPVELDQLVDALLDLGGRARRPTRKGQRDERSKTRG